MKILTKTLGRLGLSNDNEIDQTESSQSVSFKDLPLDAKLQSVITSEGYTSPTPIQARAIPVVLEGRDIIACAQTGTGKTAAFALPSIHRLIAADLKDEKQRNYLPKVLVLVPTRELALQVQETFSTFARPFGINAVSIIGGVSIGVQMNNLRRRSPRIVVATPGRLLDILEQGGINLSAINTLILDEADRMLDMGFIPDTKRIIKAIPQQRQTLMFSATISNEVNALAKQIMTNPAYVSVAAKRASAEGIEQLLYPVPGDNKRSLLMHLLENKEMSRVIIFTRTKFGASKLSDSLTREGIRSKVIHSGKSQANRQAVYENFRSGRLRILVATDLASRGIDVEGISHVVNYDLPDCAETYIHRIGRTGRANRTGIALSFCSPDQKRLLVAIERHLGKAIPVCKDHPFMNRSAQKSEYKPTEHEQNNLAEFDLDLDEDAQSERRPFPRRPSQRREAGEGGGRPFRSTNRGGRNFARRRSSDSRAPRSESRAPRSDFRGSDSRPPRSSDSRPPRSDFRGPDSRPQRSGDERSSGPFPRGKRRDFSAPKAQDPRDRRQQSWF